LYFLLRGGSNNNKHGPQPSSSSSRSTQSIWQEVSLMFLLFGCSSFFLFFYIQKDIKLIPGLMWRTSTQERKEKRQPLS
jgi:hypothetical protein